MKNEIAVIDDGYPHLPRNQRGSEKANLLEWAIIAAIDPYQELPKGNIEVAVPFDALIRWGIVHPNNIKRDMLSVFEDLRKLSFSIGESNEDKGHYAVAFPSVRYSKKDNKIYIKINEDVAPYFYDLRKRFTKIDLKILVDNLENFWARKFYVLLRNSIQYNESKYDVEFDDLRKVLGIENSYEEWSDFKKFILNPAMLDINSNSDINVDWFPIRKYKLGIVGITFNILLEEMKQPRLPMPIREAFQISDTIIDYSNKIGFNDLEHINFLAKEIGNEKLEKANKLFEKRHASTSNEFKASVYRKRILQIVMEMETTKKEEKPVAVQEMPKPKPKRDRTQEVDDYIAIHRVDLEAAVNPKGTWKPEMVEKLIRLEALARLDDPGE